jgi:Fe2+ transport system protein B
LERLNLGLSVAFLPEHLLGGSDRETCIVAGLSGILVFVPQIMILFGLITLLEDTWLYGPNQFFDAIS